MPLYQYHCKKCEKTIEELRKIAQMDDIPECDCPPGEGEMKKCIHSTGLNFVGKGFYTGGWHPKSSSSPKK